MILYFVFFIFYTVGYKYPSYSWSDICDCMPSKEILLSMLDCLYLWDNILWLLLFFLAFNYSSLIFKTEAPKLFCSILDLARQVRAAEIYFVLRDDHALHWINSQFLWKRNPSVCNLFKLINDRPLPHIVFLWSNDKGVKTKFW